jgi:ABC-type sugar transport system substrate-binding protein
MSVSPAPSEIVISASRRRSTRHRVTAAVAVVAVSLLAACSSKGTSSPPAASSASGSSATTTSSTSACISDANAFLAPYQTLETSLSASYMPLASKPAAGGSIVHLIGPLPTEIPLAQAQKLAAQAIGWKYTLLSFNGTVEDLNAKFEQAVALKPKMITLSGFPLAAISKSVADAKTAGIVVVLADISDEPSGYPGFSGVVEGGAVYNQVGALNAYQFMKASKCAGSVAIYGLAYPILKVGADAFTQTVQAHCPNCKVSYNDLQGSDLGTPAATSAIVTKLQASPSTKYVYALIGGIASGLTTALNQAGLSGITIFGADPDENAVAAVRNGTNGWWVQYGAQVNGWAEVDAGLRAIESGKPVDDNPEYPLGLLTKTSTPAGVTLPTVPADYVQQYEALWHVAG